MLYPEQGDWTVDEYLDLPGNRLVEYTNGRLEFLPMPTPAHQWIVGILLSLLQRFAYPRLGLALHALPIRLGPRMFRMPDIVFMLKKNKANMGKQYWVGADLVMEVVSPGKRSRERDLVSKRKEYAHAGIAEYWIIEPKVHRITVLHLKEKSYVQVGVFKKGGQAESRLLPGFVVDVDAVFADWKA